MHTIPETLRDNVRLLGDLLGQVVIKHEGQALFDKVEQIRSVSKTLAQSKKTDYQPLIQALEALDDKDILPIARAFNQFLNLANIADQQYYASAEVAGADSVRAFIQQFRDKLDKETLAKAVESLNVDLVLTAHPTEVSRRTLIYKFTQLTQTLRDLKRTDLLEFERDKLTGKMHRLIEEIWTTDEIRIEKPTAVDEARGGFSVIETSLWEAVPNFIRHLNRVCEQELGQSLPLDARPFNFSSWMGGDRDGNPNVTHDVTRTVLLLGRLRAARLYIKDIERLGTELSMSDCSEELREQLDDPLESEPYRAYLSSLLKQLCRTAKWLSAELEGKSSARPSDLIDNKEALLTPLLLIHKSLVDSGCERITYGPIKDTIRRVHAFGINLSPIDVRQDSERHLLAIEELVSYLGLGDYQSWSEEEKINFLIEQLKSKRPLLPRNWPASDDTQEVLATCEILAEQPPEILSHYVISMAKQASDVLAVALLLKEKGLPWSMPIVPLFETLDDLDRAYNVMHKLWSLDWYKEYCDGKQTVMIGYSDSAKDAGKLAATWAQYQAQEKLVKLAKENGIELSLFHGRGGTVGRGGGPIDKAISSQPPGSVNGHIRVTEQGEMIRYKFGVPEVAFSSLSSYTTAILKATLAPEPAPKQEWRDLIELMSKESLKAYRGIVREHPDFVPYFRSLTPEQELGKLAIGSRPAKRKATGGVESLRAIPWVFAWMQVRLNLPSWLGVPQAIAYARTHQPKEFDDMLSNWSFFSSFIDLLEMVAGKTDTIVSEHYENQLVEAKLHPLGDILRKDLAELKNHILEIKNETEILENDAPLQASLSVRKPYVDPLNYLQAELLKRERAVGDMTPELERALKVTMAGISAGMRNTG